MSDFTKETEEMRKPKRREKNEKARVAYFRRRDRESKLGRKAMLSKGERIRKHIIARSESRSMESSSHR
jgi:hypothetical protein